MASTPRWGGLRPEPYKQNAVDADGDGIVQEGTAFERPAGTSILDGAGSPLSDGLSSLERDTSWSVVDRSGQRVDYTPSYGGAFEQPKPKILGDSVGTIGSRVGTLESMVGTITKSPEPIAQQVPEVVSSPNRFGTVSKGPVKQMQSVEFGEYQEWHKDFGGMPNENSATKQAYSLPVYETNGKKISFGTENIGRFKPQFTDDDVELIPINPYVISGLDKSSAEGEKFAALFFDATQGHAIEDSNYDARNRNNEGQVSALLYAAARGDNGALEELERLANIGRDYAAEQRAKSADEALAFMGDRSEPYDWARTYPEIMIDTGEEDNFTKVRRPMNIDDLFLVHQTKYKPEFDSNGDIVIRPTKDFIPIDPATGKQHVDPITGELLSSLDQNNIHFTLNHLVEGHGARALPVDGSYVVVVPLRDVLDANPGALDNLYAIDSFLSPKPGQGITIPMNKGEVVTTPKLSDYGFTASLENMSSWSPEQTEEFNRIANDIYEKSTISVNDTLASVGKAHNGSEDYVTKIIPGGDMSSTPGVDKRIAFIGKEILPQEYDEYVGGVTNSIHDSTPTQRTMHLIAEMDAEKRKTEMAKPDMWRLGPNAKLRFFDTNKFTSGEIITTVQEEFSGL